MAGVTIWFDGLTFDGPMGRIFGPVDLDAGAGSLVAVAGPGRTGRSSLLLAAAGRLRGIRGRGLVGGYRIPGGRVRSLVTVVRVTGAIETDEHRPVSDLLRDPAPGDRRPPGDDELARAWRLTDYVPDPAARYGELPVAEQLLLDIALAVAGLPRAIVVDDVDVGLLPYDQHRVWTTLRSVADAGTTVVASAVVADPRTDIVVTLPVMAGPR